MRKLGKHNIPDRNPAATFARGLDQLINDPLINPSKFDREEIDRVQRTAHKPDLHDTPFNALLRQFANLCK